MSPTARRRARPPLSVEYLASRAEQLWTILAHLQSRMPEWTSLAGLVEVMTPYGSIDRHPYDDLRLLERHGLIEQRSERLYLVGRRRPKIMRYYRATGRESAPPVPPDARDHLVSPAPPPSADAASLVAARFGPGAPRRNVYED